MKCGKVKIDVLRSLILMFAVFSQQNAMIQPEPEPEMLEPEAEISPRLQNPFLREIVEKELSDSVIIHLANSCALLRITYGDDNFYISFDLPENFKIKDERLFDWQDISQFTIEGKLKFYDNLFLKCGDLKVISVKATNQGEPFYEAELQSAEEPTKFNLEFLAKTLRINKDFGG